MTAPPPSHPPLPVVGKDNNTWGDMLLAVLIDLNTRVDTPPKANIAYDTDGVPYLLI